MFTLNSATKKCFFGNKSLQEQVATAVATAIEEGKFATQEAVYELQGGWFAYLKNNDVFILNFQTNEEKRALNGPFNFFVGMMTEFVDASKKLYRQFMLGEVPGEQGWVGDVFPSVCKVDGIAYVKKTLVWRHVDYSSNQLEADRSSIVGNPDRKTQPVKSELGYLFSNNARIDGPISTGVIVLPDVENVDELPGGHDEWMPVNQFILDSHEPMAIAALAKGEKAGAF